MFSSFLANHLPVAPSTFRLTELLEAKNQLTLQRIDHVKKLMNSEHRVDQRYLRKLARALEETSRSLVSPEVRERALSVYNAWLERINIKPIIFQSAQKKAA
jgi:hypothetical protein